MKKILTIIFVLFVICSNGQQVVIKYNGYTSYYNPKTKIPDSVIWVASPHTKVADREAGFHATGGRPNLQKDYSHSGYDIGHNADASDENGNKDDEYNSFDWVNTYPQLPKLNRITWLALETYTRGLKHPVKVKVSWNEVKGFIGKDNVVIPLFCIKELWYNGIYEKYIFPNQDSCIKHPFTYYKVN